MKKKADVVYAMVILSIFFGIFASNTINSYSLFGQEQAKEHHIAIKKLKNKVSKIKEWKATDAKDTLMTKIKTKKGDTVVWTAEGTDLYFQFMDENLFGKFNYYLQSGKELKLKVSSKAETKIHKYAVFCYDGKEYATGDSPPVIIVE